MELCPVICYKLLQTSNKHETCKLAKEAKTTFTINKTLSYLAEAQLESAKCNDFKIQGTKSAAKTVHV